MPLEATMIILDNSEYMRNGDYAPTRFGAQTDAATTVFRTKIDSNQENTVGVMTMAGKGPEVLVTHTKEMGELLSALHDASGKLGGSASIPTAIAIAQLALKHRQNKNLRQRVLVFAGSPLQDTSPDAERALVRLAKKLKKNNVALDVIAFGDGIEEAGEGGHSILKAFVETASSSDNSHYIAVPAGTHLLSDALLSSAVLAADRNIPEEAIGGDAAAGGDFAFGVDPSLDPELAMALRMSMEEEAARQAAAQSASNPAASSAPVPTGGLATEPSPAVDDEEERLLQQALAMSEGHDDVDMDEHAEGGSDDDLTEEEMIARAIQMSMQGEEEDGKQK
ncbi:hypothetical protein K488DRAFT_51892 [Vararia minispora EC-137]|uniref:Uncharacterized protein n=1 Tax=Vararia minispora EC-137 TaxID=1314806 RepID=A0ACB8QIR1_9AGAM|nr:hypothetical protein K488DRAFT_51892 [Vararia minispora EC-137]